MSQPRQVIVHFGNEGHTTGHHVVRAMRDLGVDVLCEGAGHPRSPVTPAPDAPLVWVESGRPSFPTAGHLSSRLSAAWLIDTHRGMGWRAPLGAAFDICFAAQRRALDALTTASAVATWLPLASPDASGGMPFADRPVPVAFVGFVTPGSRRERILDGIGARMEVDRNAGYVSPAEMVQRYERSRIVVNVPLADDLNMRLFEAAGAGAFVVTGPMDGLAEILPTDVVAIVESDSATAWSDVVGESLADPMIGDRAATAAAIIRDGHQYSHRAKTILDALSTSARRAIPLEVRRNALLRAAVARHDLRDAVRISGRSPEAWAGFARQLVPVAGQVIRTRIRRQRA